MKRDPIVVVALGLSVVLLVYSFRSQQNLERHARLLEPMAQRAYVQDNLVGKSVDLTGLAPDLLEGDVQHTSLVWVLDFDRCRDCLENVGPWSALREIDNLELLLFVVGSPEPAMKVRLSALVGTKVMPTSARAVEEVLGVTLPSTKILLDGEHIVVMADARADARACTWSFDAQVGALLAANPSRAIRGLYAQSP